MSETEFDVIVIGAGPAGEVCAGDLADGGRRVAIVERELVAGECSYWACIPSKVLLRVGEAVHEAHDVPGAAEAVTAAIDTAKALAWRDFMVSDYDDTAQAKWLEDKDIALFRGEATITGPGTVSVGDRQMRAEHIVVATGSSPSAPPIDGLDELDGVWSNREVTGLKEVPRRLIVIGGGPVGVEMAQAVRRLGAEVVLLEAGPHLLSRDPAPLGEALAKTLADDGVDVRTGAKIVKAAAHGDGYAITLDGGDEVRGDKLLVAAGRKPNTEGLGAETAGATLGDHGEVTVDDHLRAADGVWAIGDAAGIWPLTYVGKYQARIVAANILGADRRASYDAVPRVVYTDPQAAAVGTGEDRFEATAPIASVARTATFTRAYDRQHGHLTLLSDGETITGGHAHGPEAGEWLQQATLAIRAKVPLDVFADTIQPFPAFTEIFVAVLADLQKQVRAAA